MCAAKDKEERVKSLIIYAAIGCISILSACDSGGDGTVESCATAMVGSFEGTSATDGAEQSGSVVAQLAPQIAPNPDDPAVWILTVWVPLERDGMLDQREFRATVDTTTGELTANSQSLKLTGSYDLNACSASGEWDFFAQLLGTWEVELPKPASF
jgi:hypothetical protein